MTQPGVTTPYSTVAPLFGALPGWVPAEDAERLASYLVYENIYWNSKDTFRVMMRGGDDGRVIYVPTGKVIVETINRFVGGGLTFSVTPGIGTPEQITTANEAFTNLFRREKFKSKYASNKRYGIIRGDWLWHILADDTKPAGERISILAVDPGSWFPIYDPENPDKQVGVHLADQWTDAANKVWVKRLTYRKADNGGITVEEGIFDMKEWWLATTPETVTIPLKTLPPQITALPVYHIRNFEEPQNPYGSSELRGLEAVLSAINGTISDEDLALALEGLGVYATDGGGPVDEDGEEEDWVIAPGRVVENAINFRRIEGVGSVTPFGDHIDRLWNFAKEGAGANDAAVGKVDVQVAESGIALLMQLAPILAVAAEKDQEIIDVHTQMFYDLKAWFQAYEKVQFMDVEILPVLGPKIPPNIKGEVEQVTSLVAAKVMSAMTGRKHLSKFGIQFEENEAELVAQEEKASAEAAAPAVDPNEQRVATELATLGGAGDDEATA